MATSAAAELDAATPSDGTGTIDDSVSSAGAVGVASSVVGSAAVVVRTEMVASSLVDASTVVLITADVVSSTVDVATEVSSDSGELAVVVSSMTVVLSTDVVSTGAAVVVVFTNVDEALVLDEDVVGRVSPPSIPKDSAQVSRSMSSGQHHVSWFVSLVQ